MSTELNFYRHMPICNFHAYTGRTVNDTVLLEHDAVLESCTKKNIIDCSHCLLCNIDYILTSYQFRKQFLNVNLLSLFIRRDAKSYSSFHYLSNEIRFLKNRKRSISNILILKVVDLGANLCLLRMLCLWFQSIWRSVQQGAKMIKAAIKIFTETSSTFMWTYQSQKKTSPVSLSSKAKQKNHHNITRLRYCLSPLSPTNLFQIQILFLSAGVNTAGTVGDIYFSIHDDIRPFHLPLQFQNN